MRFPSAVLAAAAILLLSALGCDREKSESQAAAGVEPAATGLVQLSRQRQESIGIDTVAVVRRSVTDAIPTTGWLMVKPGNEAQMKAPATGFVIPGNGSAKVELGSVVADRQEMGKLHVLL